jgi:hypothetical protein
MSEEIKELAADNPVEYQEMPDAWATPTEDKPTYENDIDAIDAAAVELDERRKRGGQEEEAVVRSYVSIGGPNDGDPRPDHETISVERASEDLTRLRDEEVHAKHHEIDEAVAAVADYNRGQAQQEAQQVEQQPQQQQPVSDDEAEMRRALDNPKIRQALDFQVQQLENQRASYAQAAAQAFEVGAAACYSQFPELNGANFQTLPAILQTVQKLNPERAQAMVRALQSTEQLHQQSRQAQAAEQQIAQARQTVWIKSESDKFEKAIASEPKETVREIEREGLRVLKESYGIDPAALKQLAQANPGLYSAEAQRLLYDAIKTKLTAEKIAAKKVPANIPPVLRPGVSSPRPNYSDEQVTSARRAFDNDPTPESAARFLQARRDARGR